jgi:hypothetical protein
MATPSVLKQDYGAGVSSPAIGHSFFIPGIVIPNEPEASDLRPIIVSTTSVEAF